SSETRQSGQRRRERSSQRAARVRADRQRCSRRPAEPWKLRSGMAIDITLDAKPEALHAFGGWAMDVNRRIKNAGDDVHSAGRKSVHGWPDAPGDSFRRTIKSLTNDAETVGDSFMYLGEAAIVYGDEMRAVRAKLDAAYDHAVAAGLPATRLVEIKDPGPMPKKPPPQRDYGGENGTLGRTRSHIAAWDAWTGWHKRAKAYAECIAMVAAARVQEERAGAAALKALRKIVDDAPITVADTLIGLAAASTTGQRTLIASKISLQQAAARQMADYKRLSGHAGKGRLAAKTWLAGALNKSRAAIAARKAADAKLGNWLTKLPESVQRFLTSELGTDKIVTKIAPRISNAPMWVKKLPVIGSGLTAVSVGGEIAGGRHPAKAVASGGGGLVAGAAAG